MKKRLLFCTVICVVAGLLWVHRRVIKAWLSGEPIPEAPAWHCWVKNRKRA